jgi:hypothetical protein
VIFMPGVGHFLMMEDPKRFNGLLGTAIDRLIMNDPAVRRGREYPLVIVSPVHQLLPIDPPPK